MKCAIEVEHSPVGLFVLCIICHFVSVARLYSERLRSRGSCLCVRTNAPQTTSAPLELYICTARVIESSSSTSPFVLSIVSVIPHSLQLERRSRGAMHSSRAKRRMALNKDLCALESRRKSVSPLEVLVCAQIYDAKFEQQLLKWANGNRVEAHVVMQALRKATLEHLPLLLGKISISNVISSLLRHSY